MWILSLLLCCLSFVHSQTFCVQSSNACIYSEERTGNLVAFRMHVFSPARVGWFAFGFGQGMDSAEVFVGHTND
jgi:hypothetical protein